MKNNELMITWTVNSIMEETPCWERRRVRNWFKKYDRTEATTEDILRIKKIDPMDRLWIFGKDRRIPYNLVVDFITIVVEKYILEYPSSMREGMRGPNPALVYRDILYSHGWLQGQLQRYMLNEWKFQAIKYIDAWLSNEELIDSILDLFKKYREK